MLKILMTERLLVLNRMASMPAFSLTLDLFVKPLIFFYINLFSLTDKMLCNSFINPWTVSSKSFILTFYMVIMCFLLNFVIFSFISILLVSFPLSRGLMTVIPSQLLVSNNYYKKGKKGVVVMSRQIGVTGATSVTTFSFHK